MLSTNGTPDPASGVLSCFAVVRGLGFRQVVRMVLIRFPDIEIERRALGFLARRFSGKTWSSGQTLVPKAALAALRQEGIPFIVEGPATWGRYGTHLRL